MNEKFTGGWRLTGYSLGMAGWSIMINTISVMLIYFYLPPDGAGMPELIPQITFLGFLTLFSLILASGRLVDAVTDPLIAWISDRSMTRWGRRIPFMALAIIPSFIFCMLLFYPPSSAEDSGNYYHMFIFQTLFYISLTLYIVPFNALMPELAPGREKKLRLSTLLSLMFVAGIIIAAQIPQLAVFLERHYFQGNPQKSYQYSIGLMLIMAVVFMFIPVFVVDEIRYCHPVPSRINVLTSLKKTLLNQRFRIFLMADASFFITISLISSGILYYVKVLLGLPEKNGSHAMALMIIVSLLFYPMVIRLTMIYGKKKLIILSFLILGSLFLLVSVMGLIGVNPVLHLYLVSLGASFPVAVLGILPYALVAEMAEEAVVRSGEKTEGMYFAVRTFADKLGQTLGVMLFAVFTLFGKDPGNDQGIRLSAVAGFVICLTMAFIFRRFKE